MRTRLYASRGNDDSTTVQGPAEQRLAADCLQRPLVPRSRFRQQLKAGVSWLDPSIK